MEALTQPTPSLGNGEPRAGLPLDGRRQLSAHVITQVLHASEAGGLITRRHAPSNLPPSAQLPLPEEKGDLYVAFS